MLLQELQRLACDLEGKLPRQGYARKRVRYLVQLDQRGRFLGLVDLAGTSKRESRGLELEVPDAGPSRTSGILPALLVDRPDYVFGVAEGKRERQALKARAAFLELVSECAATTGAGEARAVESYLRSGHVPNLEPDGGLVAFEVGEVRPVDLPEVARFWADRVLGTPSGPELECLICGQRRPAVDPWPVTVKGIPGAGTSQLASINAPAFESYGLADASSSPACFDCALQAGQALNWLLAQEDHHLRTSEASVFIFWARGGGAGFDVGRLLSNPEPDQVRELLESPRTGRRGPLELETERFYAAELSPSKTRIILRSWIDTSLGEVRDHLRDYFAGQAMVQPNGTAPRPLPLWRLAMATTRDGRDRDGLHPALVHDLLTCALEGRPLPWRVAAAVLRRLHADRGEVTQAQAALLKLALRPAHSAEEVYVQLDLSNRSPGYLCGRLLAELEATQKAALGNPKATLTDRYFGAASSAPATVFAPLLRMATQAHLPKLRRDKPGAYGRLDRQLQEIMGGLSGFPATLTLRDQALFALGFYHQRAADRQAFEAARAAKAAIAADLAATVEQEEIQ